jgi:MFS family permease
LPDRRISAVLGACALAAGVSFPLTALGPAAPELADAYGVSLAGVGLLTTALFVVHLLVQIPGGELIDRSRARAVGLGSLAIVGAAHAAATIAPSFVLAGAARAAAGAGTGAGFVAGVAYLQRRGFGPTVQGLFGGCGLLGAGAAVAVVPLVEPALGWRAPYACTVAVAALTAVLLALAPADERRAARTRRPGLALVRDPTLARLGAMHAASFGLSIVVGNWIVSLLRDAGGHDAGVAGLAGGIALMLGAAGRPLGGVVARQPARRRHALLVLSLAACSAGTLLVAWRPDDLPAAAAGAALVGLAAGIPFASAFTLAARARPHEPAAAAGATNAIAIGAMLVATPLVGQAFASPGGSRAAFAVLAVAVAAAALAVPRVDGPTPRVQNR